MQSIAKQRLQKCRMHSASLLRYHHNRSTHIGIAFFTYFHGFKLQSTTATVDTTLKFLKSPKSYCDRNTSLSLSPSLSENRAYINSFLLQLQIKESKNRHRSPSFPLLTFSIIGNKQSDYFYHYLIVLLKTLSQG